MSICYLLTNVPSEVSSETIALWYHWRWEIKTYFKLMLDFFMAPRPRVGTLATRIGRDDFETFIDCLNGGGDRLDFSTGLGRGIDSFSRFSGSTERKKRETRSTAQQWGVTFGPVRVFSIGGSAWRNPIRSRQSVALFQNSRKNPPKSPRTIAYFPCIFKLFDEGSHVNENRFTSLSLVRNDMRM